jgi:hypothetical protein
MLVIFTGIVFFLVGSILLVELVRRRKIKERIALYWASFPILVLFFAVDPFIISSISRTFGFKLVSNFLLTSITLMLGLLTLYLSALIGKMEDKIEVLAEEISLINGRNEN